MAGLYDERVLGAQQRAEFARKLRESSNHPAGQMVSGWYVPNTGGAVVDALRNVLGAYEERQATDELKGLQREKLQSTIQAMNQAGIQAPESMLKEAGTPEIKPGMWDRLTATLRGEEAKGTPAQPYQQNVAQKVSPEQKEAALMNLLQVNPDVASGAIGLYNAASNRELTKAEKEYQHAKDVRDQDWRQKTYEEGRADRLAREAADRDLRSAIAGNRQPSQPYGIETVNGQPVRINKITGEVQPVNVPGIVPTAPKLTEDQAKASNWLAQASNAFNNMQNAKIVKDANGNPVINQATGQPQEYDITPTALEAMMPKGSEAENYMRSGPRQLYMQGAESLSEALLRAATGAGVNKEEAQQKANELTPRFSDDPATRAQKERAIPIYIESLKARAGAGTRGAEEVLQSQGVPSRFQTQTPQVPNVSPNAIQAEIERRQKLKGGQ